MVKCLRRAGAAVLAAVIITGALGGTLSAQADTPEEEDIADSSSLYEGYISSIFYDGSDSDTVSLYSSDYGTSVLYGSAYEVYSEMTMSASPSEKSFLK